MNSTEKIVKSGLKWSVLAQIVVHFIKVGRWFFLLYFLIPEDFGLFALALLVIGLPQILIGDSIGSAIIQKQEELSKRDLSSFHWLLVGFSGSLLLVYCFFANHIANFFGEPQLEQLIIFLSAANFIESFGTIAGALVRKSLKFKILARIEVISFLISTFITVVMAVLNFGVWSLAVGLFVGYLVTTISYNFREKVNYEFTFSMSSLQKIFTFSRNLTFSQFITFLMRYTDDFIIGYFFGKAALGVYDRAYQIVHLPMRLIANRINAVLFPSYSAENTTAESMREIHLKIVGYAAYLYFPILIAILIFSPLAVDLILSEEWGELAFFMPILAVGGTVHAFINFNSSIFLARGRSDLQLKYGLITRCIIVLSYLGGAFFGVKGIAIGYTIGSFIAFFPESIRALKEIKVNLIDLWRVIKIPFFISMFVLVCIKVVLPFFETNLYQFFASSVIYTLCFLFFYRNFIHNRNSIFAMK